MTAGLLACRRGLTATACRKLFNTLGMLGSALAYAALALVAPAGGGDGHASGEVAAAAMLTIAVGVSGCASSAGYWASFVDLSPRHSQARMSTTRLCPRLPRLLTRS